MPADTQVLSDSAFLALRFAITVIVLAAIFLTIRWSILVFVGQRSRRLGRKKYVWAAGNALVLGLSLLSQGPVEKILERLGESIGRVVPVITKEWTGGGGNFPPPRRAPPAAVRRLC